MARLACLCAAALLALAGALDPQHPTRGLAKQEDGLIYGVHVDTTNPVSMRLAREAGFTHVKMVLYWPRLEPSPGLLLWRESPENDLDNVLRAAGAEDLLLVLRVDGAPDWAGGSPGNADARAIEAFYAAMAGHGRGRVAGYEILNEPNLPYEWGGPPDPAGYTRFLQAAYRGIKAGDPSAIVIGGGPAPNTGGLGGTIEDFDFLDGMYEAGARGFMDALAVHNYGGDVPPDRDPSLCGICFRRAELYREQMVRHGDEATPVWATEYGWLLDPGRDFGQYDWLRLPPDKQAEYIVDSYRYAAENWPWMQGLLLNNLDASTAPWHHGWDSGQAWFAILNSDHSPRPAYDAFRQMRAGQRADPRPRGASAARRRPTATPEEVATLPTAATPSEGTDVGSTATVRVVSTDGQGVRLRSEPSTRARVLAVLREGETLEVAGPDHDADGHTWRNVRRPGTAAGWVAAEFLVSSR